MKAAIKKAKEMGIDALFVLEYPNYYKRFGFFISKIKKTITALNIFKS
jgi:predicted N-acetyltransferase YhbS